MVYRLMTRTCRVLRRCLDDWRRRLALNLITAGMAGAALLVFALYLLAATNVQRLIRGAVSSGEVTAYLVHRAKEADIAPLVDRLAADARVERVQVVSREEALKRLGERLRGQGRLLEGLEENPLPHSVRITSRPRRT